MGSISRAIALTTALIIVCLPPTGVVGASPPHAPTIVGAAAEVPAVPVAETGRVRPVSPGIAIMAIGDSITAGVGARGADNGSAGYRLPLARLLQTGGYRFSMVGQRSDFDGTWAAGYHEGWPGYVLRSFPSAPAPQLYGDVTREALTAHRPTIILLMAGTNDLLRYARGAQNYSLANIRQSLDMEIGEIFSIDPSVCVIVAGVVDSPRVPHHAVQTFANDVGALTAHYRARGYNIHEAPEMSAVVPRNAVFFPDGIHPSGADGYSLMASVWYRAIGGVLAAPVAERTSSRLVHTAATHPRH